MASGHQDATFYAQVEPVWMGRGQQWLSGAKVAAITQKKPERPRGGTVEAIVVVPESMVVTNPIEVEATDPS